MRLRRILILCTGNSARSQIAEALLVRRGAGRFEVASAGSHPAPEVNPLAIEVLRGAGVDWRHAKPKNIDTVAGHAWDLVITVCDRARDACPILPGTPALLDWGMPDPAAVTGTTAERRRAFESTVAELNRRIDAFLADPRFA